MCRGRGRSSRGTFLQHGRSLHTGNLGLTDLFLIYEFWKLLHKMAVEIPCFFISISVALAIRIPSIAGVKFRQLALVHGS